MDARNNDFDFDFMPIGQAIKKTRIVKGMTRDEFSRIVDYDPRHLQAIGNEGCWRLHFQSNLRFDAVSVAMMIHFLWHVLKNLYILSFAENFIDFSKKFSMEISSDVQHPASFR